MYQPHIIPLLPVAPALLDLAHRPHLVDVFGQLVADLLDERRQCYLQSISRNLLGEVFQFLYSFFFIFYFSLLNFKDLNNIFPKI